MLKKIIIILIIALGTFLTRALPFILFPEGKKQPKIIKVVFQISQENINCLINGINE